MDQKMNSELQKGAEILHMHHIDLWA